MYDDDDDVYDIDEDEDEVYDEITIEMTLAGFPGVRQCNTASC